MELIRSDTFLEVRDVPWAEESKVALVDRVVEFVFVVDISQDRGAAAGVVA